MKHFDGEPINDNIIPTWAIDEYDEVVFDEVEDDE
jgi:hypothetical protein